MGFIVKLCYNIYYSLSSTLIKLKRVHTLLPQPVGLDTVEEVVHSSSKVLTSLISLFLNDIESTFLSAETYWLQEVVGMYRSDN